MAIVYLKYDPFKGEPIPDGHAEQYAVDVVAAANEPHNDVRHFTMSSDLVVNFVRGFIKMGAVDPTKIFFRFDDMPDQNADFNGRLKQHDRHDFACRSLMRLF